MKVHQLIISLIFVPTLLLAGFDDIEKDIQMMEGSQPVKKDAEPVIQQEIPIQQRSQPLMGQSVPYYPTTPVSVGLGIKLGTGSGSWENRLDGATLSTGDFDIASQTVAFYFADGALELGIGTGTFTYPGGSTRDFTEFTFLGNIGRGSQTDKKDLALSPYLSLGISYYFVDYSDRYDYYGDQITDPAFEFYFLLGAGISMRYDELEIFAEFMASGGIVSTGYSSSVDPYDTIETYHNNSKFTLGVAAYF